MSNKSWKTFIYNSGSTPMENLVQVSAKSTNSGYEAWQVFPSKSSTEPRAHCGIKLMETKTISSNRRFCSTYLPGETRSHIQCRT